MNTTDTGYFRTFRKVLCLKLSRYRVSTESGMVNVSSSLPAG